MSLYRDTAYSGLRKNSSQWTFPHVAVFKPGTEMDLTEMSLSAIIPDARPLHPWLLLDGLLIRVTVVP